ARGIRGEHRPECRRGRRRPPDRGHDRGSGPMTALTSPGVAVGATPRVPQIAAFRQLCEQAAGRPLPSPEALHAWSVVSYREFWRTFLDWSALAWDGSARTVC